MLNLIFKFSYYETPDDNYWIGFCNELNINITSDTFEEVKADLEGATRDVLHSMSDQELKAYNIVKINKEIKIKVQYTIRQESIQHKDLVIL